MLYASDIKILLRVALQSDEKHLSWDYFVFCCVHVVFGRLDSMEQCARHARQSILDQTVLEVDRCAVFFRDLLVL